MNNNKYNIEYKEIYQYPLSLMLNVTDDCNLACKYCFVEQHPHYMQFDTAKQAVDWVINNREKRQTLGIKNEEELKCRIYFFGGEPTLCYFSIIVPIVEYCEKKYPNIFTFGITTNGTLLNNEKIDFFKLHNFDILLSIDGNETTQNYNRPYKNCKQDSFQLISKNIPYLLKKYPFLRFRSTIYKDTVQYLFENYLYAESLGFKKWTGIEDCRSEWSDEQLQILEQQMNQIYWYRITQIINGITPMKNERFDDWLRHTINLHKDKDIYNIQKWISLERCGLGTITVAIGYDGKIYGCQEQVSPNNKSIFLIGDLFNNGIDEIKHKNLLQIYYNNQIEEKIKNDQCVSCDLQQPCKVNTINCPSTTYDIFHDMNSMTKVSCKIRKIYYTNSLLTLKLLFDLNDKRIQKYLLNILQYNEN